MVVYHLLQRKVNNSLKEYYLKKLFYLFLYFHVVSVRKTKDSNFITKFVDSHCEF